MDDNSISIIFAVAAAVSVPGLFVMWMVAEFLRDFNPPQARPVRTTNITRTTINIHIHGDLVVQVGDGERRALPAHQVQALLSDAGSTQTVRIVDPETRQFEEYRRGRLVRRGELVGGETCIARRGQ